MEFIWEGYGSDETEKDKRDLISFIENRHKDTLDKLFSYCGLESAPEKVGKLIIKGVEYDYGGEYESFPVKKMFIEIGNNVIIRNLLDEQRNISKFGSMVVHESVHYLHDNVNPIQFEAFVDYCPSLPRLSRWLHLSELAAMYGECLYWNILGKSSEHRELIKDMEEYYKFGVKFFDSNPGMMEKLVRANLGIRNKGEEYLHSYLDHMNDLYREKEYKLHPLPK